MGEITRFRCPHCLQLTAFCPAVHDALFGAQSVSPSYVSYEVACMHCRRQFMFAIRRPPMLSPSDPAQPLEPNV
jgi:hypothetical protein